MKLKLFISGRKFAKSLQYMQHKYYGDMVYSELKNHYFGTYVAVNDTIRINLEHIYEWFINMDNTIIGIMTVITHEVLHSTFESEREPGDIYVNTNEEEMIEKITKCVGLLNIYDYEGMKYKR